jgi:hypothetical protein
VVTGILGFFVLGDALLGLAGRYDLALSAVFSSGHSPGCAAAFPRPAPDERREILWRMTGLDHTDPSDRPPALATGDAGHAYRCIPPVEIAVRRALGRSDA